MSTADIVMISLSLVYQVGKLFVPDVVEYCMTERARLGKRGFIDDFYENYKMIKRSNSLMIKK